MSKTIRIARNTTPFTDDDVFDHLIYGRDDVIVNYFNEAYLPHQLKINGKHYVPDEEKGKSITQKNEIVCRFCGKEHENLDYIYHNGKAVVDKDMAKLAEYIDCDMFCSDRCHESYLINNDKLKQCNECKCFKDKDDEYYVGRQPCIACKRKPKPKPTHKTCKKCGFEKSIDDFWIGRAVCKTCVRKTPEKKKAVKLRSDGAIWCGSCEKYRMPEEYYNSSSTCSHCLKKYSIQSKIRRHEQGKLFITKETLKKYKLYLTNNK